MVLATERVVVAESREEVGLAVQREPEQPARSEHAARALRRDRRLAEGVGERRRARGAFGEPAQLQEPEVGVGRVGEPSEHDREQLAHHARVPGEAGAELAQRVARARDVGEAERAEPFLGGRRA